MANKTSRIVNLDDLKNTLNMDELRARLADKEQAKADERNAAKENEASAAATAEHNANVALEMQYDKLNKTVDAQEAAAYLMLHVSDAVKAVGTVQEIEDRMNADLEEIRVKYMGELSPARDIATVHLNAVRARKAELDAMDLGMIALEAIPENVLARVAKSRKTGGSGRKNGAVAHPEYYTPGAAFHHGRGDDMITIECITPDTFRSGDHTGTINAVTKAVAGELGLANDAINAYAFWHA